MGVFLEDADVIPVLKYLVVIPGFFVFAQTAQAEESLEHGEALFKKDCAACHSTKPDSHRSGPSLFNIFDQPAGQADGFRYSKAMRGKAEEGLVWTDENLHAFLTKPRKFIRLNKMSGYRGMEKETDRAAVIEYLKSYTE